MASTKFRYALYTVDRSNVMVGEMDGATLDAATWTLNQPGSVQYTVHPLSRAASYPQENVNEVMLTIDDVWAHQGIHMKSSSEPGKCTFDCPGLLEYFNYRFVLNASLLYTTVDQMTIAADVVYQMQHITAGQDWNILVDGYSASGVVRSLNYPRDQHQNALDILQQFAGYADATGSPTGFDFEVTNKSDSHRYFTMYYPKKGTTWPSLVLEWGRNVTNYKINRDGSKLANRMYMTGGSNGDIKFENNYQDDGSRGTYGEWQAVEHQGSESDVTVLAALAARQVAQRRAPVVLPDLSVVEVPDALLGVVHVGDVVPVRIDHGRDQVNGSYRIVEITWKPGPGSLKLKLAVP